jgi:hypothetical protein
MFCSNHVVWKFRLEKSFSWASGVPVEDEYLFFDQQMKARLLIEKNGRITVMRRYAWNGCSPKFCVFDFLIGTPDGVVNKKTGKPKTYFASMIHDVLYQFLDAGLPYDRRQADDFFLRLMEESDFLPRRLYWGAVRVLGFFSLRITRWHRDWEGSAERTQDLLNS